MLRNSAEPGTSMGSTHCLARSGFSQLYSSKPVQLMSSSIFSIWASGMPVSLTISGSV
mgnify:CR=1 FL=1